MEKYEIHKFYKPVQTIKDNLKGNITKYEIFDVYCKIYKRQLTTKKQEGDIIINQNIVTCAIKINRNKNILDFLNTNLLIDSTYEIINIKIYNNLILLDIKK